MIPNFDRFSGLHADGTRLWGVVDWGGKFVKITTDCTEVTSYNPWPYNAAHGLAVGSGDHPFFFVSEGETIVKRDKSDASDTGVSWTLSNLIIKGLTYDGGLLYIADADSKKVYKVSRAERKRTSGVSMVSENVRLSGQRKCHLNCSQWYQVTPF